MDTLIQQLINGLSLGSVYALVALGYTMVYGIINLLNFAHGDVYMVGAFVGYYIITNFNLGFLPTLILTMLITRSEEHTSELQSRFDLVCRLLLEKKKHV